MIPELGMSHLRVQGMSGLLTHHFRELRLDPEGTGEPPYAQESKTGLKTLREVLRHVVILLFCPKSHRSISPRAVAPPQNIQICVPFSLAGISKWSPQRTRVTTRSKSTRVVEQHSRDG